MFKGYIYKCTCVISGKSYVAGYSFDTGAELFRFDSVTKAAKALNLDSHSISSCASGKYKYSGKIVLK